MYVPLRSCTPSANIHTRSATRQHPRATVLDIVCFPSCVNVLFRSICGNSK